MNMILNRQGAKIAKQGCFQSLKTWRSWRLGGQFLFVRSELLDTDLLRPSMPQHETSHGVVRRPWRTSDATPGDRADPTPSGVNPDKESLIPARPRASRAAAPSLRAPLFVRGIQGHSGTGPWLLE